MNKKSDRYRDQRSDSGLDPLDTYIDKMVKKSRSEGTGDKQSMGIGRIIVAGIILFIGFSFVTGTGFFLNSGSADVISTVTNMGGPSQDLLDRMGERMVEMGYGDLSDDDLRSLREDGVTATYVSNVRSLGFEELSLDDARRLARADASSTFMAMMIELGYNLTIDDFIQLRDAGVSAFYTSNIHDLGYRDVTPDQLIRMQRIGVSTTLIEELQAERGEDIALEEIIRYRISNQ